MSRLERRRERVSPELIVMATLMLAGILGVGYGFGHADRVAFYAGLMVNLAGVLGGVTLIVRPPRR